jgi:HEPN domain-containing protein
MADETETTYLLALSPSERALYEPDKSPYGDQVETRFPASSYEIEEAGKCLALGRTTASAFHSVRCLEAAIRAIARCISIPDPIKGHERNWSAALKKIEDKMDSLWPKSGRLAGDGKLFEELLAILHAMQNPYRNSTMHLDQKYTEEEARHIFESVGMFMKKVSSRMDENGESKV